MNRLPRDKQIQIINALVEGCSIRSIERMYDTHRDKLIRLLPNGKEGWISQSGRNRLLAQAAEPTPTKVGFGST